MKTTAVTRTLLMAATLLVATTAGAQDLPGGHRGSPGQGTGHGGAEACLAEFDRVIADGRGYGMAFAADQNGYPGPLHALELKERLGLSPDQVSKLEALQAAMFGESRPKSTRLLDAEARLRRLFADGRADDKAVRAAVAAVEAARAELRLVHLLAHLQTRDLLTQPQRATYHEARWGPGAK